MNGAQVKEIIFSAGLKCWQVAELWGVNDGNFSRRLRKPFSEADVARLKGIIQQLSEKNEKPLE